MEKVIGKTSNFENFKTFLEKWKMCERNRAVNPRLLSGHQSKLFGSGPGSASGLVMGAG